MIGALIGDFWPYIAAAVGVILTTLGAYRKGRGDEKRNQKIEDHERAGEIRDRVRNDPDQRVREYDDAGWRD